MKPTYHYNGKLVEGWNVQDALRNKPVKAIPEMTNEELKAEFLRRAAECGGCNRRKDNEAYGAPKTGSTH